MRFKHPVSNERIKTRGGNVGNQHRRENTTQQQQVFRVKTSTGEIY